MGREPSASFVESIMWVDVAFPEVQMEHSSQSLSLSGVIGSSAKNKMLKHQQSNSHRQAIAEAEMCVQAEKRGSVFTQLHDASEAEGQKTCECLASTLKWHTGL